MLVAHELGKTLDEVKHLTPTDVAEWIAFLNLLEKRREEARVKAQRRTGRR
jgi:hypothetical protein